MEVGGVPDPASVLSGPKPMSVSLDASPAPSCNTEVNLADRHAAQQGHGGAGWTE